MVGLRGLTCHAGSISAESQCSGVTALRWLILGIASAVTLAHVGWTPKTLVSHWINFGGLRVILCYGISLANPWHTLVTSVTLARVDWTPNAPVLCWLNFGGLRVLWCYRVSLAKTWQRKWPLALCWLILVGLRMLWCYAGSIPADSECSGVTSLRVLISIW